MLKTALFSALLLIAAAAQAQWAWRDKNGTMVYSDRAPPADVKASQVVKEPRPGAARAFGPESEQQKAEANAPVVKKKSIAELDAEFRKRQMEKADAERKTDADTQRKSEIAADCTRSKNALQQLSEGQRFRSSKTGGIMDDAERSAETERLQGVIGKNCQ